MLSTYIILSCFLLLFVKSEKVEGTYILHFQSLNGYPTSTLASFPGSLITRNFAYVVHFTTTGSVTLTFHARTQAFAPYALVGNWRRVMHHRLEFFITRTLVDTQGIITTPPIVDEHIQELAWFLVDLNSPELKTTVSTTFFNFTSTPATLIQTNLYAPGKSYAFANCTLQKLTWSRVGNIFNEIGADKPEL